MFSRGQGGRDESGDLSVRLIWGITLAELRQVLCAQSRAANDNPRRYVVCREFPEQEPRTGEASR
jgi:hypothetical protein